MRLSLNPYINTTFTVAAKKASKKEKELLRTAKKGLADIINT